jgi:hypothetical protein
MPSLETRMIGTKEIDLPTHMSTLPQIFVDAISSLVDSSIRVVSCGVDPKDGCLYLVTANADVRFLKPTGKRRPVATWPSHDGSRIGLILDGDTKIHEIDSSLTLKHSESCFTSTSRLMVNDTYMGDFEFNIDFPETREADHEKRPERSQEIHR